MKKLLSGIIVLVMLVSAVCLPVSASIGKLTGNSISDVVKYSNNGSVTTGLSGTGYSTDGSVLTLYNDLETGVKQTKIVNLPTDTTNKDAFGYFAFKVKAGENMGANDTTVVSIYTSDTEGRYQVPVFAICGTGYMGMCNPVNYTLAQSLSDGKQFTPGQWYTVGIGINKNKTVDIYIDGEKLQTVSFGDEKDLHADSATVSFMFNIINSSKNYFDDITWGDLTEESFVAESSTALASSGETINVSFSQPVGSLDTSKIKLYNCQTGAEVSGITAVMNGERLELTMPAGLEQGDEYRVELDGVKGALGSTPYNDNVYFNCEIDGNTTTDTISEDFDTLATTGTVRRDSYYYEPQGWHLSNLWASQTSAFFMPATDTVKGNVAKVGVKGSDGASANAYLPLGNIDSGKVTISYDIKPVRAASKWNASFDHQGVPNFWVLVYPDGIDTGDTTWNGNGASNSIGTYVGSGTSATYGYGRPIAGVYAQTIAVPAKDLNSKTIIKSLNMDTIDTNKVSEADSKWYTIKVEFDFDEGTIVYYLDNGIVHTSTLTSADIDAIKGISFGSTSNARDAETLLDNVKIEHTYVSNIETDSVKGENFDDFATTATLPQSTDSDYYQPAGWYLAHKWNSQTSAFFRPVTDSEKGAVLQVGNAGSDGGGAHGYMPLGKDITSGIVTISFDMKPERVSDMWNDAWEDARVPNLVVMAYPDGIDDTDKTWAQGDSLSIGKPTSSDDQTGRYLAGIFAHTIGASRLPGTGNNTDQRISLKELTVDETDTKKVSEADSKWYTMKIELNFDERTTTYWLDDVKTIGESLTTLNIDGIQGISFGTTANARDASTMIDNVSVTHTYENNSSAGVMQVRFSDYYCDTYGTATTQSTLVDAIGIAFWSRNIDTPDENNFELYETNNPSNTISFEGSFDEENDVYLMELGEYLTKDSTYTLSVSGVTAGGMAVPDYTQIIATNPEGELVVEPVYIKHNNVQATEGTLAENDTLTSSLRIINTTGKSENFAFSMAVYGKDTSLTDFDFREITLDGITTKSADIEVGFKLDATDAANTSCARVFLWDGMKSMKPITNFGEFVNK